MRSQILAIMVLLVMLTSSIDAIEIRGDVAYYADNPYTYTPQNFPGFYYDLDNDLGSDSLTVYPTRWIELLGEEPYGIVYETDISNLPGATQGMKYGNLTVVSIDRATGKVVLANKDRTFLLVKNMNIELMPGLFLRTGDNYTIRYYLYKSINTPGNYEIRSSVATDSQYWDPHVFPGFFYDINKDLGTETIQTNITDGNMLREPDGVIYHTEPQAKLFSFREWGSYMFIGFNSKGYFAGYLEDVSNLGYNLLYLMSRNKYLSSGYSILLEQLEEILIDENEKKIVRKGESIKLKEDYELVLRGVGDQGEAYVELMNNGTVVDEALLAPSKDGATIYDKTYYYKKDVGAQSGLVTIAVHFLRTYKDEDMAAAEIDGVWQISETPVSIAPGTQFGKMRISNIDYGSLEITMDNKGNSIALDRNQRIELMPGLFIRTADNETLRYYLYRMQTVEGSLKAKSPMGVAEKT